MGAGHQHTHPSSGNNHHHHHHDHNSKVYDHLFNRLDSNPVTPQRKPGTDGCSINCDLIFFGRSLIALKKNSKKSSVKEPGTAYTLFLQVMKEHHSSALSSLNFFK